MVKAKEFWQHLCEDLNYRFFAGVPHIGLKFLYDAMDYRIMHYIPAVRESIALGLVSGAYMAGMKGGIFIYVDRFDNILEMLKSFNIKNNIPALIFVYDDKDDNIEFYDVLSSYKIPYIFLKKDLDKIDGLVSKIDKKSIPGVVIMKKGIIKR
jgi:sulfopyruvate decarboxylase TPP-binding subunit